MTFKRTFAVFLQVLVALLSVQSFTLAAVAHEDSRESAHFEGLVKATGETSPVEIASVMPVAPTALDSSPAGSFNSPFSGAAPPQAELAGAIIELTNQLLLKEIELERYYIQYRITGSKEPKYRRLRFFLLQQTAGSAALASNLINLIESGEHLSTPDNVSQAVFKGSSRLGLTSTVVGGSASAIELGANGAIALKNKCNHNDPATARRTVMQCLGAIDRLADRRDDLIRQFHAGQAHDMFVEEGRLLKTFRNWCVYEFVDVYSDIKSYQGSANVFYAVDIAAYATSYASYLIALKSFNNPRLAASSVHHGAVCDSLFVVEAPTTTYAYNRLYNYYWKRISRDLNENPKDAEDNAKVEMVKLERLAAMADDSELQFLGHIASRLAVYAFWSTRYDKYIDKRMGDMRRIAKIALQSNLSGPLLGLTGLTADVENEFGVYRYRNNTYMQNALVFAGSVTSAVGGVASVGLTGWWFADELTHQRDSKQRNILPEQLLKERLRTLDVLVEMMGRTK